MRGQGAGPGWGRHGQQPQPPPVHSAGRNEAPHPKVVVKAGSQNEALGWEAEAHGGCWKENEPRGSAGWPVPLVLLGEGSTPPTGRGGSAQTAVVSAHQAGRGWASTCPHPRPCRNEPGPSGPSLQGGCSAPQPALPGPQTLHLYRELAPRRYPVPHKTSPKGPQASLPGAGSTKVPSPPQNLPQGSPSISTRPPRALDLDQRELPSDASPNPHEGAACSSSARRHSRSSCSFRALPGEAPSRTEPDSTRETRSSTPNPAGGTGVHAPQAPQAPQPTRHDHEGAVTSGPVSTARDNGELTLTALCLQKP